MTQMQVQHISRFDQRRGSGGFSLIEIMVGLAIGVIALLVMFQVFNTTTEQNRATGSGNDAQISGTLAMFNLERDIQSAAMGFGSMPPRGQLGGVGGCTVHAYQSALATADFTFPLVPVSIVRSANVPDEIHVLYGNSQFVATGRGFTNVAASSSAKVMTARDAFHMGDRVIFTDDAVDETGICALVEITDTTAVDGKTVSHVNGATYVSFYTGGNVVASMNASPSANTTVMTTSHTGYAYNLGPEPNLTVWRVTAANGSNPGKLVRRNALRTDTETEIADGVVDLKAQYGVDANDNGQIESTEWQNAAPDNWATMLAIRFAVLARSQQFEKAEVTTAAPTWAGGSFAMRNVDGTADAHDGSVNDWRHYRYRVYESAVPLRNMIWRP